MSKGNSGLFKQITYARDSSSISQDEFLSRLKGLDLQKHPRSSNLSAKRRKEISDKIKTRTASRKEYLSYHSDTRFLKRRKEGIRQFWIQEQMRILNGEKPTRQWSNEQMQSILHNERPKYKGKTIQGHHTYSATQYPHLANNGAVIFPVTFDEHLYGWHGGNFKNSIPGRPIRRKTFHIFTGGKKK